MPYRTEWEEPAVFLEHKGVTIYHTYKDDEIEQGMRMFWYTTDSMGSENDETCFDVRTVAAKLDMNHAEHEDIIKAAIEKKILMMPGEEDDGEEENEEA